MIYDFFADKTDKLHILEYIFSNTDIQIFDTSPPAGQEIRNYKSMDEIASNFDLVNGEKIAVTFQLWTPRHKGEPLFRKIELDPKRNNGHTFRYSTDGWGLIQLYFGSLSNNKLNQSHFGHFTEKAALNWEESYSFNGKVSNWDWTEIQTTSRNLKYLILNKMAKRKIGGFGVLSGADKLEKQGIKLC